MSADTPDESVPTPEELEGMTAEEIDVMYGGFPREAISEVLMLASAQLSKPVDPSDVAA